MSWRYKPDTDGPQAKQLVKDGRWCVPVEERPRGWEQILPESSCAVAVAEAEPAPERPAIEPQPEPLLETALRVTEERSVELCPCGKPKSHRAMCKHRAQIARENRKSNDGWRQLAKAITESAKDFGADRRLLSSALIMAAGIWTRELPELKAKLLMAHAFYVKPDFIRDVAARFQTAGIWDENGHTVEIGIDETAEGVGGEIGLWLNAMVGIGEIETTGVENGQRLYRAKSGAAASGSERGR